MSRAAARMGDSQFSIATETKIDLGIQSWFRDYDRLQSFAIVLIHIQIVCALVGSLGALYNGVLLINLAISLFALVAIESSSQSLGRTYAFLLFCTILLDIAWFILFSQEIWNISAEDYGTLFIFSVKLTLAMQIVGFSVRLSSSFLWIQIYRLGVSRVDGVATQEADLDLRHGFLNPTTPTVARQGSDADEIIGGAIYDPTYYSSLFEDGQNNKHLYEVQNHGIGDIESTSGTESTPVKSFKSRSFQGVDFLLGGNGSFEHRPVLV